TLTESLVTREENIKHPAEEHDATPGIKILTVDIPSIGRFSSWDCAGHCEYHVTHTMFLGSRNSIFLVNYDITLKNCYKRVLYWLNLIKASRAPNYTSDHMDQSYVILVATHVDLVENKLQAYESAALIHQEMMSLFKDHMNIVDEVILLNSHKSREKSTRKLREIIEQCSDCIKKSKRLPKLCSQMIKRKKNWASENYPILTWSAYKHNVREIDPRVEDSFLQKATEFLVDCGE
ncbi:death-associated protein kinase dapk-1-like, partial [Anneissia japonica]|uniref:death-associated protein kinase dapk-1-like n=1 Tax=Anneissia japonica TaxID=1529436 RepID=UPI001425A3E7